MEGNAEQILPGLKPVLETLESTPQKIDLVLVRKGLGGGDYTRVERLCQKHAIRLKRVETVVLNRLCRRPGENSALAHQGILARLAAVTYATPDELVAGLADAPLPVIVALDQVQDPGNLGTLARTLYALGGAGLLVPEHNSAGIGPGARRTAAGALEKLPVARAANLGHALDFMEEAGLTILGTGSASEKTVAAFGFAFPFPCVIVLGNEEKGLRPGVVKRCRTVLHIPMQRSFNSLNVAQAGAVLLGLAAAQRM